MYFQLRLFHIYRKIIAHNLFVGVFFFFSFGSCFVSPSTGIILNNEMDDFSTPGKNNIHGFPPSPSNYIKPYKRPMSSMCPTIMTDHNEDVVLVIGGAGGSKITLATAYVMNIKIFL